jgi:hypothetical protein
MDDQYKLAKEKVRTIYCQIKEQFGLDEVDTINQTIDTILRYKDNWDIIQILVEHEVRNNIEALPGTPAPSAGPD